MCHVKCFYVTTLILLADAAVVWTMMLVSSVNLWGLKSLEVCMFSNSLYCKKKHIRLTEDSKLPLWDNGVHPSLILSTELGCVPVTHAEKQNNDG